MASACRRLIPFFDRVLLQRADVVTKTKGGILIPENAQKKVCEASVVAVGSGRRTEDGTTIPVSVKVGDTVLVPEYGGTKVELDGQELLLLRESELLGVFEG